jgi:hypothetical protein
MLFKGTFNWYCELHILYTHAKNESKAFDNFIVQLAKLLKVTRLCVYYYFIDGKKDNWRIERRKQLNVKKT